MFRKSQALQIVISTAILVAVVYFWGGHYLRKEQSFLEVPEQVAVPYQEVNPTDEQRQEIEGNIAEMEALLAQEPENLDYYWSLALQKKRLGDLRGMAEVYVRAIEANPLFYLGYSNLGATYKLMGEYSLAEEAFLEAIVRNPKKENPYLKLGELYQYHLAEKKAEIEPLYRRGIENVLGDGHKAVVVQSLAEYYYKEGRREEALQEYRELADNYGIASEDVLRKIEELEGQGEENGEE